jgi:thiol-disulfide isomerase/thioredoxin
MPTPKPQDRLNRDGAKHTVDATRRAWMLGLAGLGMGGGLAGPASAQPTTSEQLSPISVGQRLTVPALELLSGGRFDPREAEGRALVLYWWASWCPFCAIQSPHMQALWQEQQARGLRMLGLSIDRTADDALRYWRAKGYSFPIAMVTPAVEQRLPKPRGLPAVVVRGRDGRVAQVESGQLFPEDVQQLARFV